MISKKAYECYVHTIKSTYNTLKLLPLAELSIFSYSEICNLTTNEFICIASNSIKRRLEKVDFTLIESFIDPQVRVLFFNKARYIIPLLNQQALSWYGETSIHNFDFIVENYLGMHFSANTIYDIGGHQGIWALYYSSIVGDAGEVFSFEPSIINVECACLTFLLNNIVNIVEIPLAIGNESILVPKKNTNLLIDFIHHNVGLIKFDNIFWRPADFIKIDIEGYEYEFITSFPNLFDFCSRIHLELHIPHLINRSINYREIYDLIPFDRFKVFNYYQGNVIEVKKSDNLEGFCSLMIISNDL